MASSTVAQMTKKEFIQILSKVIEQKLVEQFGDPDEGLIVKEHIRKRLIRQKKATAKGDMVIMKIDHDERLNAKSELFEQLGAAQSQSAAGKKGITHSQIMNTLRRRARC